MASWMVATPNFASAATAAAGARSMLRTAIPDLPIMSAPCPDVARNADLATHDETRGTQERSALDLGGVVRTHREGHREFPRRVLYRKILARAFRHARVAIRHRAGHHRGSGHRDGAEHSHRR